MQMEFENINVHYHLYNSPKNDADYLILIHGLGLDLTMWEPLIPCLSKYYHIVTFDMRGHGETKGDSANISWEILVNDFYKLVTALSIPKFHLLGFGFGGNLAIKINEIYPELIKKLILTSVYMFFPKSITKREIDKRKRLVTNGKMSKLANRMIRQICINLTPETELLLLKAYDKTEQSTYFSMFQMLVETVSLEELRRVNKEVLLIQGDSDPLFPIQQTNLYQSYLKNSISYVVHNASNLVPLDNPKSFITLVGNFIKDGISSSFSSVMEQELADTIPYLLSKSLNTLEINVINGFTVKYKGNEIKDKWNQRKAKNLLAYIAYHNPSTREDLIEEFWGESELNRARNNLRVSLNHLKSILASHGLDSHLQIGRENISLVGDISSDLFKYMNLLHVCEVEPDSLKKKSLYRDLVSVYRERMFLDLYDDWLMEIQQEIDAKLNRIARTLVEK